MSYQCPKPCRYMESVTARETDLFLPRVPLSKQILVLYMLIHHNQPGIEKLAFDANMDEHCVNTLVGKARKLVSWWMVRVNLVLHVGGLDEDAEADEVSFRNAITGDDDKPKIQWTRFVGVVRRGSSLYCDKCKARGWWQAWHHHMMKRGDSFGFKTRPLIARGSVLHTDTASTYMQLHRLNRNPLCEHLGLWVTQVRHSRKRNSQGVMQPVQFVVRKKVQLLNGDWVWRKGARRRRTASGRWFASM